MIKHKKVELTELFYDLVYVYAISQTTSLIHHLHHGTVPLLSFLVFFVALIILINTWMIQTVFTNRYGTNSLGNIISMFIQMAFLLISSTATTTVDEWQISFRPFVASFAGVTAAQLVQYIYEHVHARGEADRVITRSFMVILSLRLVSLLVSTVLPIVSGTILAISSIVITWLLPYFATYIRTEVEVGQTRLTNFPHLAERLSLLVIIMFGETIIGITPHFHFDNISISSFLIFWIVTNFFFIYIVEMDHMIEVNREDPGVSMVYSHYFVFFGLSFLTVSLSFLGNTEANQTFALLLNGLGQLLFLTGVVLLYPYNKMTHRLNWKQIMFHYLILISGIIAAILLQSNSTLMITCILVSSLILTFILTRFNLRQSRLMRS